MTEEPKNLTVPRAERNVWDEPARRAWSSRDSERWMTAGGGGALALLGARMGGLAGYGLALLGGTLAIRAAMGRHDLTVARNRIEQTMKRQGWKKTDRVEDASQASFPASDAPSWTGVD